MGRIRGKRNRDSDRYWHERRKQTQAGMVAVSLEASALCAKCGQLTRREHMHKGWCLPCVAEWVSDTDPWLILQAQSKLPSGFVPTSLTKQIEALQARIAEPPNDDDFLPLTRFYGHRGVGSHKSMWNVLHAMHSFELTTTAELYKLGAVCPNTTHLCGRHAPVPRSSLQGFLSRIKSAGDEFKLLKNDRRLLEYLNDFVSDNRIIIFPYNRTSVDVYDRAKTMRFVARYGKTHFDKHCPAHWPFESEHEGKQREAGTMEELPDFVMEIGAIVDAHKWPPTVREDLCQDLVVAVLTGEVTVDGLRTEAVLANYVREVFKNHPLRYGRFSLDAGVGDDNDGDRKRIEYLTADDVSPDRAARGWLGEVCVDPDDHRPSRGIATLGDIARANNNGHAIQGPNVIQTEYEMDEDIREVFFAEQRPRWRQRLSV